MLIITTFIFYLLPPQLPIRIIRIRRQQGLTSVYFPGDGHSGTHRADGKRFTVTQCHIAHRHWPLGSLVRVCSQMTKRCVFSHVRDRGPFGACDHKGINPKTLACRGKWLLKIRHQDPGHWRGISDLSLCIWKKIGGPALQNITLDLLYIKYMTRSPGEI